MSALRQRSAALLSGARRVVTPSADCAGRIHRHFPRVRPEVIAPETDGTGQYPKPVFPVYRARFFGHKVAVKRRPS